MLKIPWKCLEDIGGLVFQKLIRHSFLNTCQYSEIPG